MEKNSTLKSIVLLKREEFQMFNRKKEPDF